MRYGLLLFCFLYMNMAIAAEIFLHAPILRDVFFCIVNEVIYSYDTHYATPCSRIIQKNSNPIEYEWGRYPWGQEGMVNVIPRKLRSLRSCLKALSLANKSLLAYFSEEKVQQNIIDISLQNNFQNNKLICMSEDSYSQSLGYRNISEKINRFHRKAGSDIIPFSPKELEEIWYLKSRRNDECFGDQ